MKTLLKEYVTIAPNSFVAVELQSTWHGAPVYNIVLCIFVLYDVEILRVNFCKEHLSIEVVSVDETSFKL